MLSHPCTSSTFRFFIIKFISSSVKVMFSKLLFILNSKEGNRLQLWECIQEGNRLFSLECIDYWSVVKREIWIKSLAFSVKFETTLPSTKIGGILGIFLLLKKSIQNTPIGFRGCLSTFKFSSQSGEIFFFGCCDMSSTYIYRINQQIFVMICGIIVVFLSKFWSLKIMLSPSSAIPVFYH